MFPASPMSEFKFACPVCGQRMAVDSSASGAQVECPTCFQIIIVPKAPAVGSKYQLSATQYIKPFIPPPPLKPAAPVAPQTKYAVLIFVLILVCAAVTALFIRERIVRSQQEQAKASSTSVVPPVVSPLWTLDLTNATFPEQAAAGEIHGKDFVCREAVLQNGLLMLRSERGWQALISANVFVSSNAFSTNAARILSGRSFEVGTNYAGFAPSVTLFWQEGDLRVMEMFTNNFALKLEFGNLSSNRLPGRIYLCLPDALKSYVAGSFTAEVQRFPPPRSMR
jgi:ribosomal protein S27E